jgi:hypothetical protein
MPSASCSAAASSPLAASSALPGSATSRARCRRCAATAAAPQRAPQHGASQHTPQLARRRALGGAAAAALAVLFGSRPALAAEALSNTVTGVDDLSGSTMVQGALGAAARQRGPHPGCQGTARCALLPAHVVLPL